jgi:hypothetical protein
MPGPAPVDVVVIGNLTIDDVVRPNGETTMASPGGNRIYAGTAARLWGVRVGVGGDGRSRLPDCGARPAQDRQAGHQRTTPD